MANILESTSFQTSVVQHGREIFRGMDKNRPSIFRKDFWNGKIMDWSMKDEAFKIEMFRFVDVFPTLKTSEQLARHLQEYFCRPEQDFPAWIQLGLKTVSPGSLIAKGAAIQIKKNLKSMARDFVAGVDAQDALKNLKNRRKKRRAFTVDLLGEATVSEKEGLEYQQRYLKLIRDLSEKTAKWPHDSLLDECASGPIPRVNVSIKLTSLYSQVDPADFEGSVEGLKESLMPLLIEVKKVGAFLNVDMESYDVKEVTLEAFRRIVLDPRLEGFSDFGIVIQAYLRDSLEDTKALIEWAKSVQRKITIRLVKGAYWDYETIHAQQEGWPIPVYQEKTETDLNFEACLDVMLQNSEYVFTAIGSHNVRSIAVGMSLAEKYGVPKKDIEVQVLYGMGDPMKNAIVGMGYRIREYVPVGELIPGMAYLVRRLLENTSNEGFLKAKFHDDADTDLLLARPVVKGVTDPVPDSPFLNEPMLDLTKRTNRERFETALKKVRESFGKHYPLIIDDVAINTKRHLKSTNPADPDEIVGTTACADIEHAEEAILTAYQAFNDWRDRSAEDRADYLVKVADELRKRRFELAALIVLENGKSWHEADADVAEAIDFCRYYAQESVKMMVPHKLGNYPGEQNHLIYQPRGVGAVIAPWNFPIAILTGMLMGALATGNCVILKPAEQTPVIAAKLMEIIQAVGIPKGVVTFLPGIGEEVGAHLVEHKWIRFIAFTGSRDVGLQILQKAYTTSPQQPGVKSVVCEMGGKNAIIVDDDADLDEAVAAVLYSTFGFQGQKCSACSRVIIVDEAHDEFVERLIEAVKSIRIGPPEDPRFTFGPVIDEDSKKKIEYYIELGKKEGTPLLIRETDRKGHYAPFAIFKDIKMEHRLAQEEVFGPVLAIMRAADFDEAIRIANATSYALTGGVISRSPYNLDKARKSFKIGNLYINRGCTGALVYRQPFGGFKYSGTGAKAGGANYLHQFVEERSISENTMRRGFAPES